MFRRLFGKKDGSSDPSAAVVPTSAASPAMKVKPFVDDAQGDPIAREWIGRLARGEWQELPDFLAGLPSSHRAFYSRTLAVSFRGEYPDWVDDWVQGDLPNPIAHQFRGDFLVALAWERRGPKVAKKVRQDQAEDFFEALVVAKEELENAATLAPDDAGPVGSLIDVAKGLDAPRDIADELFAEAQRRDPWAVLPARSMVQYLTPKWHGSLDDMLAFVRSTTAVAPAGLSIHGIVAEAHVEAWLELRRDGGWWKQPGNADEILAAAAKSIDVFETDAPWDTRTRNAFAFCFWRMGLKDRARAELERVGPSVTYPWILMINPVNDLQTARWRSGLPSGR